MSASTSLTDSLRSFGFNDALPFECTASTIQELAAVGLRGIGHSGISVLSVGIWIGDELRLGLASSRSSGGAREYGHSDGSSRWNDTNGGGAGELLTLGAGAIGAGSGMVTTTIGVDSEGAGAVGKHLLG